MHLESLICQTHSGSLKLRDIIAEAIWRWAYVIFEQLPKSERATLRTRYLYPEYVIKSQQGTEDFLKSHERNVLTLGSTFELDGFRRGRLCSYKPSLSSCKGCTNGHLFARRSLWAHIRSSIKENITFILLTSQCLALTTLFVNMCCAHIS